MAKTKSKEKKAFDQFDIECPHCEGSIHVRRTRHRTNPVAPPEYDFETDVEALLPATVETGGDTRVTKADEDAA